MKPNPTSLARETVVIKRSEAAVHRKTRRTAEIRFEDQRLTSFAGLVMFQLMFNHIVVKQQLAGRVVT